MKIEIWSDIVCPFCYIGKRRLEQALEQFEHKDRVVIEWKSFQLNPHQQHLPDTNIYDYLAEIKGQSREWSVQMHESVRLMAKSVGLEYNFDQAQITNTFEAHRLLQLAKTQDLGDAVKERLCKAYFTEGALISDHDTLLRLAVEVGMDREEVQTVLSSRRFTEAVEQDIAEAHSLGIRGVPFFLMDRKDAVSGAQSTPVFLNVLQQSFTAWEAEQQHPGVAVAEGASCTPDGDC